MDNKLRNKDSEEEKKRREEQNRTKKSKVDEAGEESFPASDAPSYSGTT